ncbi:MAG: hypothetical protein ACI4KF_03170 [Huintestinicola sp.]
MNLIEYMKLGMSMAGMSKVMKEYGNDTIADLADRFKNKYVKEMLSRYLSGSYMAITFITSYGFYTSGTAAIPMGGSVGMVDRIAKRFEELGGKCRQASENRTVTADKLWSERHRNAGLVESDFRKRTGKSLSLRL